MRTATERATAQAVLLATLAAAALAAACTALPGAAPAPAAMAASAPASPAPAARPEANTPAAAPAAVSASVAASVAASSAPAAVSPIREPPPADAEASLESAARSFYAYFDRVRQMSPNELGREFARLDQPSNPTAVLELALALGQTRNPNDTVRALATLDPLLRSTDPQLAPWRPLARLLAARYTEQRRLEEQIERQNQQLRDAQRRQEQLAQQLEALKAIERSLNNRPASAPVAPGGAAPPAGSNGNRATQP
jgi:hypothetical protein